MLVHKLLDAGEAEPPAEQARVDVGNSRLRRVLLLGPATGSTTAVATGIAAAVVAVAAGGGLLGKHREHREVATP